MRVHTNDRRCVRVMLMMNASPGPGRSETAARMARTVYTIEFRRLPRSQGATLKCEIDQITASQPCILNGGRAPNVCVK